MKEIQFFAPFDKPKRVDRESGVIHGVSIITSGVKALGHDLHTDDKTLQQMLACATLRGQVPVKENHKRGDGSPSGVAEVTGYLDNFRIEPDAGSNKMRGDWHLLKSHPRREQYLETAERMPTGVGMSAAFVPPESGHDVGLKGEQLARCAELRAVDYVTSPAANPGGMFSDPSMDAVDKGTSHQMSQANPAAAAEPTLSDLLAELKKLSARQEAFEQKMSYALDERGDAEKLAELEGKSDAELQKLGITREDIAAAKQMIAEAQADAEAEAREAAQGKDGKGEEAAANAGADKGGKPATDAATTVAPAAATAALSELREKIVFLEAYMKGETKEQKDQKVMEAFDILEQKVVLLAAENEALRIAAKTPAAPALRRSIGDVELLDNPTDKNVTTFERQVAAHRKAGKTEGQAIMLAVKEDPEGHRAWLKKEAAKAAQTQNL